MDKIIQKEKYETLKLENQICFPLYAAAKEIIKRYKPVLDEFDLTYTQYITLMVLWQSDGVTVKELGQKLFLDSGTLTPVLKSMEQKGYLKRQRAEGDERSVRIFLTDDGVALKDRALDVPQKIAASVNLSSDEATTLYRLLYKILN